MKTIASICEMFFIAAILLAYNGCTGKQLSHTKFYPGTGKGRSLVVLLPTIGGKGSQYEEYGLMEELRMRGTLADAVVLNVNFRLYLRRKTVEILKTEVIDPAKAKGYKRFYLVGTSLGGHGALLYATQYPEDVDALFLFAPFISGPLVTKAIEEAGGLDEWKDCPFLAWKYACNVWKGVKDYASDPERRARVYLGYGTEDKFARECRTLAEVLPAENVFTVPGGHDWATWKELWIKVLDHLEALRSYQRRD